VSCGRLAPALAVDVRDAMLPPEKIDKLVAPFLGGNDPVFGFLSGLTLPEFFDAEKVRRRRGMSSVFGKGWSSLSAAGRGWSRRAIWWCTPIWRAGKGSFDTGVLR